MSLLSHLPGVYGALPGALVLATAKKTTSSSSGDSLIIILLILAVGAYLVMGPQRKRRRQAQEMQRQIAPGDEVVTTSGIVGHVENMTDDRVRLTIAPETTIEVLRGAIARRIDPPVSPVPDTVDPGYTDASTPWPSESPWPEDREHDGQDEGDDAGAGAGS